MATTTTAEENKRLARRYPEEVASRGDVSLIDELCSADVVVHSPLGEVRGREQVKAQIETLRTAFGDFSATVDDIVAEGQTVAMRVTLRGTHEGEFMGIAPTGTEFEVANMVFTRVEDGQIAERWVHPDILALLRQLGVDELPEG